MVFPGDNQYFMYQIQINEIPVRIKKRKLLSEELVLSSTAIFNALIHFGIFPDDI